MDTHRILWAAMASSLIAFFVITQVVPPGTSDGSVLNVLLPVLAVVDLGLSFVIPRLLVQFQQQPVAGTRGALLLALAICESVALMGLILHKASRWSYFVTRAESAAASQARPAQTASRRTAAAGVDIAPFAAGTQCGSEA